VKEKGLKVISEKDDDWLRAALGDDLEAAD